MRTTNPQLKRLDRIKQYQANRKQGVPKVDPIGIAFDRAIQEGRISRRDLAHWSETFELPEGACPEFVAFHESVLASVEKDFAALEARDAEMIAVFALTSVKKRGQQKTKKKRGF